MAELFKFRCFQCQKLIGSPPSKYGKVVNCPKCGVELIVPSPDEGSATAEEPDPDTFRPEDFGIKLETGLLSRPRPTTAEVDPVGPDPIAFLRNVAEAPEPEAQDQPPPASDEFPNEPNVIDLPEPATEPLVARKRGPRRSTLIEPTIRARDVVLPRTAAVAWSLFGLLALAFAFAAGLLVGHFLWK